MCGRMPSCYFVSSLLVICFQFTGIVLFKPISLNVYFINFANVYCRRNLDIGKARYANKAESAN